MFTYHKVAEKCYYCREKFDLNKQKDHIVARSIGGPNWHMNYIAACPKCNKCKSNMTLPEFARWLEHNNQNGGSTKPNTKNRIIAKRVWKLYNKTSWLHKRYGITGHKGNSFSGKSPNL